MGVRILLNKVSVITVANKKTETPTNLIDSFLKQTLVEKELLIMTDSTLKSQDNIKVFAPQINSGGYESLLEQATGDYVLFMHPNEYFGDENALEELLNKCVEAEAQVILCGSVRLNNGLFYFDYYGDNVRLHKIYRSDLPIFMTKYKEFKKLTGILFQKDIVTIPHEDEQLNLFEILSKADKILFDMKSYYVIPIDVPNSLIESEKCEMELSCPTIEVKNITETLHYVKNYETSVARFGDGEIDLIHGHSIPYQVYDEKLAKRLNDLLHRPSDEQLVSCLPDVFHDLTRYNEYAQQFWREHLSKYALFYWLLGKYNQWFGSTFISRPYIDWQDKTSAAESFARLKELWYDRDVLIVEGALSQSGVGNDLFAQAKSVQRIIAPSKNAFTKYEEILSKIKQYAQGKLVLIMLGPTAKLLVEDLSRIGIQAIDLGHIDSEYEWFLMGATHKVKFNHKHTAEHNFDEDIELNLDETYLEQIVARVE